MLTKSWYSAKMTHQGSSIRINGPHHHLVHSFSDNWLLGETAYQDFEASWIGETAIEGQTFPKLRALGRSSIDPSLTKSQN
ncbi:hypothetical protein O181_060218 [Austropuccinia psidii MF-1]|uniref:Uncharacterized protein n=1 Tax=Austropuccinia psidii MF-1 TaxID=1389203 RepID=A0A9Q3EG46_9BASI|nr:hypothetical protein [Austropuccinia psidii MF-1]